LRIFKKLIESIIHENRDEFFFNYDPEEKFKEEKIKEISINEKDIEKLRKIISQFQNKF